MQQLHTHSLHKPISHPIRKTHAHTNAPVTLIHRLRIHMWSDGAVDTVDRCGGKDGFQSACQARVGSTSTTGGLTRALAHSQGCVAPDTITHTANGQCNWAEQFYHRCSVLYGRFVMHHLAYINISLPIVSSPESVPPEPHVQSTSPHFLTRQS